MTLPNLGAHTDGGLLTVGQGTKEATSNNLDDLLDNSSNKTSAFVTTAGGALSLATPQANLDQYLESGLIRLTGTPAAPYTVDVPDGDKRIAFENASGQTVTIDTVTGAASPVTLTDGATKIIHIRGIEITIAADDSTQTGALLADGTVAATGDFDWGDNQILRAELKDYSETSSVVSSSGGSVTLNLENGNTFDITLTEATTFIFSNPPTSGKMGSFTLFLRQDGTGTWASTWPSSVAWTGGGAPTFSLGASQVDLVAFASIDGGTTWFGKAGGLDFS